MEKEILNIIYSYTFTNKLLDKRAVLEIVKIIMKEYDLFKEIKSIYISEKQEKTSEGLYGFENKDLLIYLFNIKNNPRYEINFKNRTEKTFYKNVMILQTILHELRHAYQGALKGKERYIIEYALNIIWNESLYLKTWKFNPSEREAEFFGFKKIIKMLKENDTIFPTSLECVKWSLYHEMHRGYKSKDKIITGTPLKTFFKMTCSPKAMYEDAISLFGDCSFYKRVSFGLPITEEEKNKIENKEKISTIKLKNS